MFQEFQPRCDHDTSPSQTDGWTTCHSNTALCVASRGKNTAGNPGDYFFYAAPCTSCLYFTYLRVQLQSAQRDFAVDLSENEAISGGVWI